MAQAPTCCADHAPNSRPPSHTAEVLPEHDIVYADIRSRAKSRNSFKKKLGNKIRADATAKKRDPAQEITDLAGIRVITYIESDAGRVCDVIRQAFRVHQDKSLDKSQELGVDRVGYRSVHFVCDLGEDRGALLEYERFNRCLFEVQVRTLLQHAWAEIEHGRGYKFSQVLPTHLRRRFGILAGMLELAGREFDSLALEIDEYARKTAQDTAHGDLSHEINSETLRQYLDQCVMEEANSRGLRLRPRLDQEEEVIEELREFGIDTIKDLDRLFTPEFWSGEAAREDDNTYLGVIRDVMIWCDIDRYFNQAWQRHWLATEPFSVDLWARKYERSRVIGILSSNGIRVEEMW